MMKKIRLTAILLGAVLALSGCGGKKAEEVAQTEQPKTQEVQVDPVRQEIDSFFEKHINTEERPIAVMVDNDDKNARPQAGLDEAYLIYELTVEGGSTRFMGVFKGADTEKIGPVRSSRHYFLDYALENDAIYTHFGWSPRAMSDIPALGVKNINGILGVDESIFWREQKFKGDWHSAYTSIAKIREKAQAKGYALTPSRTNGIKYSEEYKKPQSQKSANTVKLVYSPSYRTSYIYNEEKAVYEKYINGAPHSMQNGKTVQVKNVLVQLIYDTSLGDGTDRRNINTTGSGKGYYISEGLCEEISWSKASRGGDTIFKRADGSDLSINPGRTIINIISPAAEVVVE